MTKTQYAISFEEMYRLAKNILTNYDKGGASHSKDYYEGFTEALEYCIHFIRNDMKYSTNNEQDEIGE